MGLGVATARRRAFAAALCAALAFLVAASLPTTASAQSPICAQYPDIPQCNPEPDFDAGEDSVVTAGSVGGPIAQVGPTADQGATDSLPFTGYPLTALLLLLLVLLLAGLALRAYLALRDRLTEGP